MSRATLARLTAVAGAAGIALLVAHVLVVGGLPADDATRPVVTGYLVAHHDAMSVSAWTDGFGSLLVIAAVTAMVHLAGSTAGIWARLTTIVASMVIALSLVIDAALIAATHSAVWGDGAAAGTLWSFANGIDFVFPVANSVWMPLLGIVLFRSSLLPPAYAPLIVLVGAGEFVVGTAALFSPAMAAANNVVFVGLMAWMLAASVGLAVGARKLSAEPEPALAAS